MAETERPYKPFDLDSSQQWRLAAGVKYAEMYGAVASDRMWLNEMRSVFGGLQRELDTQAESGEISAELHRATRALGRKLELIQIMHAQRQQSLDRMSLMFEGQNPGGHGSEPFSSFPIEPTGFVGLIVKGESVEPKLPDLS